MRKWFNQLKVSQKLMLIGIFFVIPDSLMLFLFITGINANIQFAQLEIKGNEYQRPLEQLLELIPQHRRLAQGAGGSGQSVPEPLAKKQAQIDAAFQTLAAVDARIGADLQFTDEGLASRNRKHYRVGTVREEWQELKTRLVQLTPEARADRHLHLMADVRGMITHSGDLSNLILDPDLDSYYTMDVTLLALPQTQDRLAAVMADGEAILRRSAISNPERRQLAVHATLLKEADLDRIKGSLRTALNEDAHFFGSSATLQTRVPPALKEYADAAEAFIDLTTRLVGSDTIDVTAEEYLAAGNKARDASFKLWKVACEELDTLLRRRIGFYEHRRATSLMLAAFTLLAAVGLITFITRSISGPLHRQALDLQTANGALQAQIAERGRVQKQFADSEHRLRVMFDSQPECVKLVSAEGTLLEMNPAGLRMIEADHPEQVIGQSVCDLVVPEHREDFRGLNEAVFQGESRTAEFEIIGLKGTRRWIETHACPLRNAGGKIIAQLATTRDVTGRKRAAAELGKAHKDLVDVSRLAGMAEVATSVLHNVGNVLNSVNVSATVVSDTIRRSDRASLSKVVALLREHEADLGAFLSSDAKGRQIVPFLGALAEHLSAEQAAIVAELKLLQNNIDHIKDVVSMQQSHAKVSGVVEQLQVADLIEDTLRMNAESLARHDVEVVREFASVPDLTVDKHKLLQILVNLIRNAKHSCDEAKCPQKRLTLRVANGNGRVKISVSDNGMGIPPENLTRIFNHGFTTKKDGHGFGLHSGALAAREMGGALLVHSDGVGCGATFTVELPLHPSDKPHA